MRWFGLVYLNSIAEHEIGYFYFSSDRNPGWKYYGWYFCTCSEPSECRFRLGHMQPCGRQVCLLISTAIASLGRDKRPWASPRGLAIPNMHRVLCIAWKVAVAEVKWQK